MEEAMTPQEARDVNLPRWPWSRHKAIVRHLGNLGVQLSPLEAPFIGAFGGRKLLVKSAISYQDSREDLEYEVLDQENPIPPDNKT